MLLRFLTRITFGEWHTAEDLLQETLLRAWRHLDVLPDERDLVLPWLFTVARRVAIDAARSRQSRPREVGTVDLTLLPEPGGDIVDVAVARHIVHAALPKLSEEHRSVIMELYFGDASTTEAARRLGIAPGTVKSRAFYALRTLRAIVGPAEVP
ncbi:sigma-70 family RNA polymerase sigma factor [Dactylosporangium sp. CA-092794]|uniref:sigma-70 family RNA polymerase sigma factor n=1 Tax=Dactylosporangium sp. CA-092794 TaxID=3239929 RepID=UPI003D8F9A0A